MQKHRLVKITRTITLTSSATAEMPDGISNEEIQSALEDKGELWAMVDMDTSIYEAKEESSEFEVEDALSISEHAHYPETSANLYAALISDELIKP